MHIQLNDGNQIPAIGLGVWKARRGQCYSSVLNALETGYRHIDTAAIYGNEEEVGKAITESQVPREKVFLTTKLWNSDHGYETGIAACEQSLRKLGIEYTDLYLIHFPVTGKRLASYEALLKLQETGKTRSIGVSNYTVRHLDEIKSKGLPMPSVNQVEFHPWLNQIELADYCSKNGIALEAYSPLGHGQVLEKTELLEAAAKLGKTPAQMLIRWSLQKGNIVIPKSANPARIRENFSVFDFDIPEDIMTLMNSWNENLRTCWDPSQTP